MPKLLEEAATLVSGDRQNAYGHPRDNFERIAKIWSVVLGIEVTPREVALCMIGLKVARDVNEPRRENLLDIVGYADCADQL